MVRVISAHYKDIVALSSASAASALAFLGQIYLSGFFVAVAALFYFSGGKRINGNPDVQLYGFVRSLLHSYKRRRSMLVSLEESVPGSSEFERRIANALEKYKNGDAVAFLPVEGDKYPNVHAREIADLVWRALHNGDDVYVELCRLKYSIGEDMNSRLKRIGQINNARFVSLIGIVLFFPLFAGIGTAILASAPQIGSAGRVSLTSITFVFAAYLTIECFVHFKDDSSMPAMRKVSSSMLCSSFGLLLLKAGSLFAISAI